MALNYNSQAHLTDRFLELSNKFATVAEKLNLPLRRPTPEVFRDFAQLPNHLQQSAIDRLDFYFRFCVEAIETDVPRTEKHFAWFAIKTLGLVPPSELFSLIKENDIVEIYDSSGIQVYRSFNFGNFTSYSLEDVLTYPWYELFIRDKEISDQLLATAQEIFVGQNRSPLRMTVPPHRCVEGRGEERLISEVEFFYATPLYDKAHSITHFLATSHLRLLGQ